MNDRVRLSTLWDRVAAWLRDDLYIILPVAGAFFFLPSIILTRFVPSMTIGQLNPSALLPMILIFLLQTVGQLAIFELMLDRQKPTVGQSLRIAFRRLLPAVGVQLMLFAMVCALLVVAQLVAAIFGGAGTSAGGDGNAGLVRLAMLGLLIASPAIVYLLARFSVVFPVLMTEPLTPFESMRRAFNLTQGSGWKIAGLIVAATMLYLFVQLALGAAFGGAFTLIGRLVGLETIGVMLTLILVAALGAAALLVMTVALGFIYRDLAS